MGVIENAVKFMTDTANDNSHGYDQTYRWNEKGDYDCSSLVISAYKQAGVPLTCTYTGNMRSDMLAKGFTDVTNSCNLSNCSGMQVGDVLLNTSSHTAMYIGNGRIAQASINEKGTTTGGQPGDQTGKEILTRSYYNYPWNYVLRYGADVSAPVVINVPTVEKISITVEELSKGSEGIAVKVIQTLLNANGFNCGIVDGEFGTETNKAVRAFQRAKGLIADGIVGVKTWEKILNE